MPLKIRRRRDTGALEIYGTVRAAGEKTGVRVRERAGSDDPATAREEAIHREREILRTFHLGQRPDVRSFAEAYRSYLMFETRSIRTIKTAFRVLRHFGGMGLDQINQEAVDRAREVMFEGRDVSPATVARSLVVPLRAIMMHAADREWCAVPRLKAPSSDRRRPEFLMPAQVEALIAAAASHLRPLLRFLVCTGCRLGEALALDWRSVDLVGARATLWEGETKSGKRRVVELVPAAVGALEAVGHRTGHVFLTARKQPYRSSEEYGGQIKTAWRTACVGAGLSGVGPHVLRHSWASHFYAIHKDILLLQREGGWSNPSIVERYTHIFPAGHEEEILGLWGLLGSQFHRSLLTKHPTMGRLGAATGS
jgi:integrase